MNNVTKEEAMIASEQLYHQARHKERLANFDTKRRDHLIIEAAACRKVARILREKAQ